MKKPFAYISAAWSGQEFTDTDQAVVYCRKVYQAGFTPICPTSSMTPFPLNTRTGLIWRGSCYGAAMC